MQPIDNEQFNNANSVPEISNEQNNNEQPSEPFKTPYFVSKYYNPGYLEHHEIKRRGNILGFAFCLTAILNIFFFAAVSFILVRVGFDINVLLTAIEDPFYSMVFQIAFSLVAFLVPFLIAAAISKEKISKIVPLKRVKNGTTLPFMLIGFGFLAVANLLSNIFSNILMTLGISNYQMDIDTPHGVLGFLITVLSVAVVPALVEEFAYRGVFLGLLEKYGEKFCIIASAVMFALMHGNLSQIPFAFLVGLVLGFIRVKSGSVVPAILLHFINNFVSVVLLYLTENQPTAVLIGLNTVYYAIAVLCIAVGILTLKKDSFKMFKINEAKTHLYESQKTSAFYTAPFIIISYIVTFILIVISELTY